MQLTAIILLALLAAYIASLPVWPYSLKWGYGPSGGAGVLFVLLMMLAVIGVV